VTVVDVIALGGTIAMANAGGPGVVPALSGEMLVTAVPALKQVAEIRTISFRQLPGAHLGFHDLEELAAAIEVAASAGSQGVVVTQGTDTIEETAFALDRLLEVDVPVIVTGAMRNPTLPGADGPANLLAAVQVAASPLARALGVLVVMNDEIHAARFVRKGHTSSPAAFSSPLTGPLGLVSEGRPRVFVRPERVPALRRSEAPTEAPVALVTVGLGDDGRLVRAAVDAGYRGLVIQGLGGGHVSEPAAEEVGRAAQALPVVLASRTCAGEVLGQTYGFAGSEIDLQRRGVVRAGWLDGPKARVLLSLALRHGTEREGIAALFTPWGADGLRPS
jgi:L-asparaginase